MLRDTCRRTRQLPGGRKAFAGPQAAVEDGLEQLAENLVGQIAAAGQVVRARPWRALWIGLVVRVNIGSFTGPFTALQCAQEPLMEVRLDFGRVAPGVYHAMGALERYLGHAASSRAWCTW